MKHINIPLFIPQMGCPFQCIFCQQQRISYAGPAPSPSQIAAIIENHLSTVDPDQSLVEAAFFGGSFTALPWSRQEAYLDAVQPYLQQGRIESIRISTRPDSIDRGLMKRLAERKVRTIELGVQSFDDYVLQQSRRGYRAAQAREACRLVKEFGFHLGVQLMIGLPGDNPERDLESTRLAIEQSPDMVRIYPTLVIAGTELEKLYLSRAYRPLELEKAVAITRNMYLAFQARGIPVIRMGLHPGEELRQPGNVVAGPFHPAFGELVEQAVFKEQALRLLGEKLPLVRNCSPVLVVNDRDLSKMLGWKRRNIREIIDYLHLKGLQVQGKPDLPRGAIRLLDEEQSGPGEDLTRGDYLDRIFPAVEHHKTAGRKPMY